MMSSFLFFILVAASPQDPIIEWDHFINSVRDGTIRKEEAESQFPAIFNSLKDVCRKYLFKRVPSWVFPLEGYGIKDIGAGGFKPGIRYGSSLIKGYNFYDGDRHGGHPAYDIFIRDRDQDSLDDASKKQVMVLAPVDLLILSVACDWESGSEIRGGRYVWALDPLQDQIFYFAHLNEVHARAGAYNKAGSVIGTVGRTGKNAAPGRSPTHLHLMVLTVKGSALVPFDFMDRLRIH